MDLGWSQPQPRQPVGAVLPPGDYLIRARHPFQGKKSQCMGQFSGKTIGKRWDDHGKTTGKLWENHGKTMGKPWENCGKIDDKWVPRQTILSLHSQSFSLFKVVSLGNLNLAFSARPSQALDVSSFCSGGGRSLQGSDQNQPRAGAPNGYQRWLRRGEGIGKPADARNPEVLPVLLRCQHRLQRQPPQGAFSWKPQMPDTGGGGSDVRSQTPKKHQKYGNMMQNGHGNHEILGVLYLQTGQINSKRGRSVGF